MQLQSKGHTMFRENLFRNELTEFKQKYLLIFILEFQKKVESIN